MARRKHPEDDLAMAVADFISFAAPDLLWWHTPNGGKRAAREAMRLSRMGVLPGVADLCFVLPSGKVAFIELKVESSYQSPAQKAFQNDVEARGCPYVVCRSIDDVRVTLEDWGVPLLVSKETNLRGAA